MAQAQESPNSIEVQDIQFKLHEKLQLFNVGNQFASNVSLGLLAVASSKGLLFTSNPTAAELKVFILKDLVDAKDAGKKPYVRTVALPCIANLIACSADGSMLAVSCTLNGSAFMQIYSVASFVTPNTTPFCNIRLSAEENVNAVQLLWNPVLVGNLAVVLKNGSLQMYTLKENGSFEVHSLERSQQVTCGSWSPKGKQIVLGFPNGKLQQFKPDLTPAKTIVCPVGVHPGPFDTIALHWLSTFQFAAVFLQHGQDMSPSLYIINAPKGGTPHYINYYDICYSACGPRAHQIHFTHVQQWNLLLMTSANGVEVGILGTRDSGDMPTWHQYTLLDEARIEMPLTESKDETYPIGFAFDTSSSHQLIIAEKIMPVMPMVYVLSTYGHLISFNFLNLTSSAVDICSPPPPVSDSSGQFVIHEDPIIITRTQDTAVIPGGNAPDNSFALTSNAVTSTPAVKDKPASLFGNVAQTNNIFGPGAGATVTFGAKPVASAGFGVALSSPETASAFGSVTSTASAFTGFGGLAVDNTSSFGAVAAKPAESATPKSLVQPQIQKQQTMQTQQSAQTIGTQKSNEINKPLYTVPASFVPPSLVTGQQQQQQQQNFSNTHSTAAINTQLSSSEIDESVRQMIAVQIAGFELEMKQLSNQSKGLLANLGNVDELKGYTKRLNDLQEINEQAKDRDFEIDVQNLQHALNEIYAIQAECRTKFDVYNNPDITRLASISKFDPINRRQLSKLHSYLAMNQVQMQQLQQQIDTQWSNHQDLLGRNSKSKMHIPCLEGIYKRMTKFQDLLSRQRVKLNYIKSQLKQNGLICKSLNDTTNSVGRSTNADNKNALDSLVDSMLTMSMCQVVETNRGKLTPQKLNAIRKFTQDRQEITIIRPQRPNRVGLKSEVILETRLRNERKVRENVAKTEAKLNKKLLEDRETQNTKNVGQLQTSLPKPTATKPSMVAMQTLNTFAPPTQTQQTAASFNFGTASPFVKTSAPFIGVKADDQIKPFAVTNLPEFSSSSAPQSNTALKEALAAPISFSAKVISGDTAPVTTTVKSSTALIMPTASVGQGFAALTSNSNATATNVIKTPATISTDKENLKSETNTKPFTFGTTSEVTPPGTKSTPTGFVIATTNTTTTKSLVFDGKPSVPSSGNFSFSGFGNALSTTMPSIGQMAVNTTAITTGSTTSVGFTFGSGMSQLPKNSVAPNATSAPPIFVATTKSIQPDATSATVVTEVPLASNTSTTTTSIFAVPTKVSLESAASTTVPTTTSSFATYTFNNGAWNLSTADNVSASGFTPTETIKTPVVSSETKSTSATGTLAGLTLNYGPISTTTTDSTDSLFGNLNICKPTTTTAKENDPPKTTTAGNLFSGFGASSGTGSGSGVFSFTSALGGSDAAKPTFGSTATAFSFSSAASPFGQPSLPASTTTTAVATTVTTAANVSSAANASTTITPAPIFASATTTTTTTPIVDNTVPTTFSGLTATNSVATTTISTTIAATTGTTVSSIFGGAASFLTTPTTSVTTSTTASSIFGAAVAAPSTTVSSIFTAVASTATTSPLFGSTTTTTPTGGNIFGTVNIPKPEQSVFGSQTAAVAATPVAAAGASGTGIFAAAAAANPSPFSSPTAVGGGGTGGNLFGSGGTSTGFGASSGTAGSIFGGGSTAVGSFGSATGTNTAGSIFGGVAKSPESTNVFGSPTQPTAASGGSIFGQSTFGQPAQGTGNLFGGVTGQQPSATGFGTSGGSIFGGSSATNSAANGSIFGGNSGTTNSTGFGGFSAQLTSPPAFGSPTGGTGSFVQTGSPSVAQSGFGSPQQGSAFAKPVFGGAPAFGSPPAFSAQPSFGGAATFGSPKGFGSFAAPNVPATSPSAFGATTQKSNLFEALGSSESGLSFGNLAQTTNPNAAKPKPTFGGSSFMNYRA